MARRQELDRVACSAERRFLRSPLMTPSPSVPLTASDPVSPVPVRALLLSVITALALMVLPVIYWLYRVERVNTELSREIVYSVDEVSSHLSLKLRAIELVLRGVRGFVEGSDEVTASEFHAFVKSLQIDSTAAGLLSVALLPAVNDADLQRFLAEAEKQPDGQAYRLSPQGRREVYGPILFIEPRLPQNIAILGQDVLVDPVTREAALRARDSAQLSLSSRFVGVEAAPGDEAAGPTFVMYLPIFRTEAAAGTGSLSAPVQLRPERFVGWAGGRFRFKDIAQKAGQLLQPGLHLQVFEGNAQSEPGLLFGLLNEQPAAFLAPTASAHGAQKTLDFGGQRWTYTVTPTDQYLDAHADRLHHWLAALGLLLSLAVGLIVWLLMTARDRALAAALQMTAELRALSSDLQVSERALREAQRVAAMGHFWVDVAAREWRGSAAVCELLGVATEEAMPLDQLALLVQPHYREPFTAACVAPGGMNGTQLEFAISRASDSQIRWLLMSGQAQAQALDDAASTSLFFTLQDVTDRHHSENQLRLLEKAVASLNDVLLITEAEPINEPGPRIVFVNEAFERMTGYTRDEVIGKTPRILQGPDTSWEERVRIREALLGWQPVRSELINYTKAGKPFWVELAIQPIADDRGWFTHWVAVERDITERRAAEDRVNELAFFDPLTRLPNRSQFMLLAAKLLGEQPSSGGLGAAILIDLDNFKVVNDHWGHHRGDQLLIQIARRLRDELSEADILARMGGDEFIVLLPTLGSDQLLATQRAEALCGRLLASVAHPMVIEGREYFSSASLGLVVFAPGALSVEELLSQADSAMYDAKNNGRNTYRFFDSRLQAQIAARVEVEADLRQSIERKELFLLYQPQVDSAGQVTGAEALCRWRSAARGLVSPAEFIPLAESTGFIQELGPWVLERACAFLADWRHLPGMNALVLSVNVSARQFHHPDFVRQVQDALRRTEAPPTLLKLELTESIFADDLDEIVAKMETLKALGVRFSLDDFGTGYSSLSYLKKLPLDQLKIDQSFVRDVLTDSNDEAIIRTVIALGQSMGLSVIAEGVENEDQRAFLLRSGCVFYQGYLFGRPMDEDALVAFVKNRSQTLR